MQLPLLAALLVRAVLGEVIGPSKPSSDCHADNCYRAVAGKDPRFDLKSRREDCSRFMTPATGAPFTASPISTALPAYASACHSAVAYSSACSCWGIKAVQITADAGPTATTAASVVESALSTFASSSRLVSNSTASSLSLSSTVSSVVPSSPLLSLTAMVSSSFSKTSTGSTASSLSTMRSSSSNLTTGSSSTTPSMTSLSSTRSTSDTIPTLTAPTNSTGGCLGGKCGTYRSWTCSGPLGECLCGLDPDGKGFCFEDNVCSLETDCNVNKDCPSTQRCVVGSCCLVGKCVIERKDGVCGNLNSTRALFGVRRGGQNRKCNEGSNSGAC